MTNTKQHISENELDIGLNDIIDFFVIKWKILLMGTASGLIIALSGTLLLGEYEAEATLINKSNIDKLSVDKSSIDYLTWKNLKRNLPILAARVAETAQGNDNFLKTLSDELWWQKNVNPTFALAKDDAKSIFGISKELQDSESTKIQDFVVKATGSSRDEALKNLSIATSFMRGGAAYLALNDVIASYQMELLNLESELAKKTSTLEIELKYLNGRKADLELLKVKFPASSDSMTRPMDPKDSSAKYLPITTQLIAAHKDISALKEDLSRLNDRRGQLAILNVFLSQAKPVMDRNFDGLSAVAELIRIEASLRKELQSSDWNKVSILNNIKYELALINSRFSLGLEPPTFISTHKPHYLKNAAIGLAAGFFLTLVGSLCAAVWLRYRRQAL